MDSNSTFYIVEQEEELEAAVGGRGQEAAGESRRRWKAGPRVVAVSYEAGTPVCEGRDEPCTRPYRGTSLTRNRPPPQDRPRTQRTGTR